MALIRWQPWYEMETLRRQLDQLFDELTPITRDALSTNSNGNTWTPAIELKNTDSSLILRAELPGIDAKDLDIQVTRNAIVLSGEYKFETKSEERRVVRSEFRYGNFHRVIPLPVTVQNDRVKADFEHGILTLTLPKFEADRPKVVKVNLNGTTAEPVLEATNGQTPAPAEQAEAGDVWAEPARK
jgi:HSP20 family protein